MHSTVQHNAVLCRLPPSLSVSLSLCAFLTFICDGHASRLHCALHLRGIVSEVSTAHEAGLGGERRGGGRGRREEGREEERRGREEGREEERGRKELGKISDWGERNGSSNSRERER